MTPGKINQSSLEFRASACRQPNPLSLAFFVALRGVYGLAWMLAGITKETEKHWLSEPGVFLHQYLLEALDKPNVTQPYKYFIEAFVIDHILLFNYAIPITQIVAGACIILGLFTLPALLVCLFMHINFILSGNMNEISLVLYTSAFLLFLGWKNTVSTGADALLRTLKSRTRTSFSRTDQ